MPLSMMLAFIGLLYLLGFGALSFVRRQGLSSRFIIEGLVITAVGALLAFISIPVSPILFLIVIYLITMRVRLLTDLANWFNTRKDHKRGLVLYEFALRLWPDAASRLVVLISRGLTQFRMQDYEAAYHTLEEAMPDGLALTCASKYLAAGYYNLGVICRRTGRELEAIRRFNQAIEMLPTSIYTHAAERALGERQEGKQ